MPVKHPCQHKQQVRQAVEVLPRRLFERLFIAQSHHGPLGAARHGSAHMGQASRPRTGGQNKLGQRRQRGIVLGQRLVQRQHRLGLEQLKTGDRQFSPQVEQLVLDLHQQHPHTAGHVLAQQHTQVGIELVHIAHGVHPQAVFRDPGVVAQAGGAAVASAGGNLCQSLSHDGFPLIRAIVAAK